MKPRHVTGAFCLFLVLSFVLLLPLSAHLDERLPDDGDAILGLWIIWWSATHWQDGYPEIFDANAFYPHPQGLLYSEAMLSQGVLSWPMFTWLDNPVLAMNLLTLVTLALSATAMLLLAFELTGSRGGAVVGAIAYTFSAYSFSQLPRIQLITLQWLPLALFCLHRFFARGRYRYLVGFAVLSMLQAFACFYYLAFYLVALAVLLPVFFLAYPEHRTWRSLSTVGLSGSTVGVALAFVAVPYWRLYGRYEFSSTPSSSDLAAYFTPGSESLLYGWLGFGRAAVDHFIGYAVLLVVVLGVMSLWRDHSGPGRKLGLAYLAVALLGFFLSSGPTLIVAGETLGPGPYALLQRIPPYDGLRTPDRFSVLVTLGVGIFVAYGVRSILTRQSTARAVGVVLLLSGLVLAEHWSFDRVEGREIPTGERVPDVYRWLDENRDDIGVVAEMPPRPFRAMRHVTLDAYFSTFHERTILFNKPSFYPPAMELLEYELQRFPTREAVTLLRALGVSHAVVHPKRWEENDPRRSYRQLPEAPVVQTFADSDDPLWEKNALGGEYVVALRPMEAEEPPEPCRCREIPRKTLEVAASGTDDANKALDGSRETAWRTDLGQRKGDFFEIRFEAPTHLRRIELGMAFPYGEFPRHVDVNGYLDEEGFRMAQRADPWQSVALVRQLVDDPTKARFTLDFAPQKVDRVLLFINKTVAGSRQWSIPEVYVYEADDASR